MPLNPRELDIINREKEESAVIPFTEFQTTLQSISGFSQDNLKVNSESKSIYAGVLQELKNLRNDVKENKTQEPALPKQENQEEINSLHLISAGITTLIDLTAPIRDGFQKLTGISEGTLQAIQASTQQDKALHKIAEENDARNMRKQEALLRDLDEDLEYQTESTRKKELQGEGKKESGDRSARAESFLKSLFNIAGMKPVFDFLKFGVDFFKDGFAFFKTVSDGFSVLLNPTTGLLALTAVVGTELLYIKSLMGDIADANEEREKRENEADATSSKIMNRVYKELKVLEEIKKIRPLNEEEEKREKELRQTGKRVGKSKIDYYGAEPTSHQKINDAAEVYEKSEGLFAKIGAGLNYTYELTRKFPDTVRGWFGKKEQGDSDLAGAAALGTIGAGTTYVANKAVNKVKDLLPGKTPSTSVNPNAISQKSLDMMKHQGDVYEEATKTTSKSVTNATDDAAKSLVKQTGKTVDPNLLNNITDDAAKKAGDIADDVAKQTTKTQGLLSRFYNSVKDMGIKTVDTVKDKTHGIIKSVKEGIVKVATPVKETVKGLADDAAQAVKNLGRRGFARVPGAGILDKVVAKAGNLTSAAVGTTKEVTKKLVSKAGPLIATAFAVKEASSLAGEGDYLGAAKALLKGGISFAGGAAGGAIGTLVGPAGTVVGSVGGSMVADQLATAILGETRTQKDEPKLTGTKEEIFSQEEKEARKKETLDRMKEARTERYNELLAEGKSAKEIKAIIQKEFVNLQKITNPESITETVAEEIKSSGDKTTDTLLEIKAQNKTLSGDETKLQKDNFLALDKWFTRIFDFLKTDFIGNLITGMGFFFSGGNAAGGKPQTYTGQANLTPKLGSASTMPSANTTQMPSFPEVQMTPQQMSFMEKLPVTSSAQAGSFAQQINETIRKKKPRSVFLGKGEMIEKVALDNGIDPAFLASILMHESAWGDPVNSKGEPSVVALYNNPSGSMTGKTKKNNEFRQFSSLEAGVEFTAKNIKNNYLGKGLNTIEAISKKYAPIGAANDPKNLNQYWAPNVKKLTEQFGGSGAIAAETTATSALPTSAVFSNPLMANSPASFPTMPTSATPETTAMPAASTPTTTPTAILNVAQEPGAADPGYCARGVVNTLSKAGYGPIQCKDAKEMANVFASHPRFQEINPSGQGRESILSLPPGTVVVYQPKPGAKYGVTPRVTNKSKTATKGMATYGHTFIYLGNGKESSDTVRNVMPPEDYGSWRAFKPLNKGDIKSFTTVPVGKQSIMQTVGLEAPTEATSSGATAPAFSTPAALPGASISGPITNPAEAMKGFDLSGAMKSFIGASADTLSQIPGLPKDMQEVLQKVKGMDSKDLMTASSQFHIQNPNWANESMGSDLTGLRMNKAEVTPKTVKPDAISTQSAKVESKPVSAPDAAPLPPSPAAQIEQSMSPLMQGITSVMNMPQQLMGAMSGGGQQPNTNSSGPNIDDLSLQLLQKLFIAD